MQKATRFLVVLWFAAALATPLAAFLLGGRGSEIEIRPLADPPEVSWRSLLDAGTYAEVGDYFTDHLPFRDEAVRWDAAIDLYLFGDSPNPKVGLGADGWLFAVGKARKSCAMGAKVSAAEMAGWVGAVGRLVEASGRRFLVALPPPKAALYPEHLGALEAELECSRALVAELHSRLAGVPGYIDILSALETMKPASAEPLYYPNDHHWTTAAGAALAREIVESLRPGLWDPAAVRKKRRARIGSLSRMIGLPQKTLTTWVTVARPGVEVRRLDRNGPQGPFEYAAAGSGAVFEGRVFAMHDSFMNDTRDMVNAYVARSTFAHWNVLTDRVSWAAARIVESDVVILEKARFFNLTWYEQWRHLPQALARELTGRESGDR